MAAENRFLSDVLQDFIRNVQEIVRSEVRLAKTEIREEAAKAKSATLLLRSSPSHLVARVTIPGGLRWAARRRRSYP